MKRKMKGLFITICLLLSMFILTACSSDEPASDSYTTLTEDEAASYKSSAQSLIEQIVAFTDDEIEEYLAQNDSFTNSALESWEGVKDSLGTYNSVTSQTIAESGDTVTVTSVVNFEKADCTVELVISVSENSLSSMSFNVAESLGQQMTKAALNTVMGLVVVFAVLIFLTVIISLFRYIPQNRKDEVREVVKEESISVPEVEMIQDQTDDGDLAADDGELVAVIAAAIAASENTSADSFVVRSIRKSNKWKRA